MTGVGIERDILCTLCDYNLRGLVEPRCPECGYQFVWDELLNEERCQHKWLFEHQRRRRPRSFFRTLLTSLAPRRFWDTVFPLHRVVPRRLVLYWLILTMPLALAGLASLAEPVLLMRRVVNSSRQATLSYWNGIPDSDPGKIGLVQTHGSLQAAVAAFRPMPTWSQSLASIWQFRRWHSAFAYAALFSAWPWIAVLSFVIFRDTLRQAKIKAVHVLRCAMYCSDWGLIFAAVIVLQAPLSDYVDSPLIFGELAYAYTILAPAVFWPMLTSLVLMTYRLTVAYRKYLGFRYAIVVSLWTQMIFVVLLAVLTSR